MSETRGKLLALERRGARAESVRLEVPSDRGLVPPHDLPAEAAVISAMMLDRRALEDGLVFLRPDDFYSDPHRLIFETMKALHELREAVDVISVAAWLRRQDKLALVGGPNYLHDISDGTPAVGHIMTHARVVRDLARLRDMAATCALLRVQAMTGVYETPQEMLDTAARSLDGIATDTTVPEDEALDEALEHALDDVETAQDEQRTLGVPTGLLALDRLIGYLKPGAVTIIGARTSMGKTSLARHIAHRAAMSVEYQRDEKGNHVGWGCGVQFFQMEGKRDEMALDWAHTIGRVDSQEVRCRGGFTADERARLRWAQGQFKSLPIWVDDNPGQTAETMRARVRARKVEAARRKVRLRLVVVDYLQLMESARARRGATREELVSANSRALKRLAMENDVHVIALSQLNRALEDRSVKDKRPRITDLRESGAIENDAHNIILLFRPEYYDPDTDKPGVCEAIIEKQRGGARQMTVDIGFEARYTRFYDIGRDG